ncbi:hypothetical protein COLO4_04373 [Corchorus olitorius]|uniref:Uncharacterized protein n=1 Tax=Corchorus olitorius TaxID=93759 RepID=A0A1R3KUC2_9ROSI|nr:hypothetical protein COLO4_04373 [Corchorus olitorius]
MNCNAPLPKFIRIGRLVQKIQYKVASLVWANCNCLGHLNCSSNGGNPIHSNDKMDLNIATSDKANTSLTEVKQSEEDDWQVVSRRNSRKQKNNIATASTSSSTPGKISPENGNPKSAKSSIKYSSIIAKLVPPPCHFSNTLKTPLI